MRIIVSGSLAYDIILDYPGKFADHIDPDKIHALNLSFLVDEVRKTVGGTAANIAFSLGMLGVEIRVLGSVGPDGKEIVKKLSDLGADVSMIRSLKQQSTATAYIMTDLADNQINAFYPGAMNARIKRPKLKDCDWPVIAPENPENMTRLAVHYQKSKDRYIFDPGQQIFALNKTQLNQCVRGASIIFGNDYEIGMLQKKTGKKKFKAVVYKTLGPKGSEIIFPNNTKKKIGAVRAKKIVDPTGAGDAYRAGVIKGIADGLDLVTAGQLGATAAVFAVEAHGTQSHKFDYGIIRKRHNRNFN